jgi:hypothetical protein
VVCAFLQKFAKKVCKKSRIFLKKHLKFPDECVIIFRLTFNATKRKVAIAPIFPRRIWGISVEQVRLKAERKLEEKQRGRSLGTARIGRVSRSKGRRLCSGRMPDFI